MKPLKLLGALALLNSLVPSAHAQWWKPILVCDGGAAVVDLDLGERRNVQLVVRDRNIADYFSRNHGLESAMDIRGGQIVVQGRVGQGIFSTSQLQGFEVDAANAPAVQVLRDGPTLKLRVVSLAHKRCIDWRANDFYCAESVDEPEVEYANWVFRSCQEQPANP